MVISTPLSGFVVNFNNVGSALYLAEVAVFPGQQLFSTFETPISNLSGTGKIFDGGNFNVITMPKDATSIQFTLVVARIPAASSGYGFQLKTPFDTIEGSNQTYELALSDTKGTITAVSSNIVIPFFGLESITQKSLVSPTTEETFSLTTTGS